MYRTFNCGIGMVVVVNERDAEMALSQLKASGETAWVIGTIQARQNDEPQTRVE